MTKKEALAFAKTVISYIDHVTTENCPRGSGYFDMCNNIYELPNGDEMEMCVTFEVCKYRDDLDGRLYYGVFYYPMVVGGDAIGEPDWDYTEHCRADELADILLNLENIFTKDYLLKLFEEKYEEIEGEQRDI